jgi:DNA-binding NarL/FixJ family response regulator
MASMHRVLIGQFGTVARMGLRELLDGQGIEVVAEAETNEGIVSVVNEVRPDVVLLDLDDEESLETASELTSEFPAIKVIACSCEEPVMRVFPPFHHGESYASKLSAAHLALALSN